MTESLYSRRPLLNKDTAVCISLAARPSNIGTRFHNYLYDELGLDFVYKAFTTTDIAAAIGGVRALGIRGCSVSMPFKEDVIALVDELEGDAEIHADRAAGGLLRLRPVGDHRTDLAGGCEQFGGGTAQAAGTTGDEDCVCHAVNPRNADASAQ